MNIRKYETGNQIFSKERMLLYYLLVLAKEDTVFLCRIPMNISSFMASYFRARWGSYLDNIVVFVFFSLGTVELQLVLYLSKREMSFSVLVMFVLPLFLLYHSVMR